MSYQLVEQLQKKAVSVSQACRVLQVSPSGYYAARLRSRQAPVVCAALQMAIAQRNPVQGLLVHSKRGAQYASGVHQALLTKHGLVGSMSRKGNCWDNPDMARFFLSLKMERVWQHDHASHGEAIHAVADYIVNFYNSVRLHSKLDYLSPNAFEQESATQSTY